VNDIPSDPLYNHQMSQKYTYLYHALFFKPLFLTTEVEIRAYFFALWLLATCLQHMIQGHSNNKGK
jgi:hypothetical protein